MFSQIMNIQIFPHEILDFILQKFFFFLLSSTVIFDLNFDPKANFVDSGMVKTCDELDLIEGSPSFLIFVVPFLQWNDS